MELYFTGTIVGIGTFLIIGICHPLVIKGEYYFSKKIWWAFLAGGLFFAVLSLFLKELILSCMCAALGFSLLWGIGEVFAQEKRVLKGWFPENPARKEYYEKLRKKKNIEM